MSALLSVDDLTAEQLEALAWVIEHPDEYCELELGDDLWDTQKTILRTLAIPRVRLAVKSCHSSGKTRTASRAVVWFIRAFPRSLVITTAPTWTQVKRLLWKEVNAATERFIDIDRLMVELRAANGSQAIGLSTNEGVRFQGFHADHILIVGDEAAGIAPDIYEAIDGIRASGDVRVLLLGNPTVAGGEFYEAFENPSAGWRTMTISAFDTPNLAGLTPDDILAMPLDIGGPLDQNPRPYLVTRRWVREMFDEHGLDSPQVESRVFGEFPSSGTTSLYPMAWLNPARDPGSEPAEDDPWVAGVDVAGPGEDELVVALRHGNRLVSLQALPDSDAAPAIDRALAPYRGRLAALHIDAIGIGWNAANELERMGWPVNKVIVSQASRFPEARGAQPGFANLKAELYWAFRERLKDGQVSGLRDEKLRRQLAAVRYGPNRKSQIAVEEKPEYVKRVGHSPDRAEAVILCYLPPVARHAFVLESMKKATTWNM